MSASVETLNENQRKAVLWNDGPLLVLAGPGSGKTRVLTHRVARILEEDDESSVLALTFTNKAAVEMRERVERLLGQRASRARLCTFHSFATDILRQHGSHVGLRPDFSLLVQDEDRIAVLEDVVADLRSDGEPLPSDRWNLLRFVDRLFAESYDGGERAASLDRSPTWVSPLYRGYCDALVSGNRLDFGSLLYFARRLLSEKPGVGRLVRLGWTHVCVDEFQDTNKAQYDFLRLIAPQRTHNLFVVADDDQVIYQWNGASPERLAHLRRDYNMSVVQLPECYRCPPSIVTVANRLIAYNVERMSSKLSLTASADMEHRGTNGIRCRAFESPEAEATFIPKDIRSRGLTAAECVVLGRTAKLLSDVVVALTNAKTDAVLMRRKDDFESPAIRVLVEALRLANARHDREILRRLCVAWTELSDRALESGAVAAAAALSGGDFLRTWTDAASATVSDSLKTVVARIRSGLVDDLAFREIVEWFLDQGWKSWTANDYMGSAVAQGTGEDRGLAGELEAWRELHEDMIQEYGVHNLTLNVYLQQMDLMSKVPPPKPDTVRCMTVHGSKGLEFEHVYLIGMAQEVFPSFQALRNGAASREVEEERRNCFVAITRAERSLTLTRSEEYYGYAKEPSQFLEEMGACGPPLRHVGR